MDPAASHSIAEQEEQSSSENSNLAIADQTEPQSAIQPTTNPEAVANELAMLALNQEAPPGQASSSSAANSVNQGVAPEPQSKEPPSHRSFRNHFEITDDHSEVFDIANNIVVPMPSDHNERMRLLARIFDFASKLCFFFWNKMELHNIFACVPEPLWNQTFTNEQTVRMVNAQSQLLINSIVGGVRIFSDELKALDPNYPALPTTLGEVQEAQLEEARRARMEYFVAVLANLTPQTDRWLREIFRAFQTTLDFPSILDPTNGCRANMAAKVAGIADGLFQVQVADIEVRLRRDADMEDYRRYLRFLLAYQIVTHELGNLQGL